MTTEIYDFEINDVDGEIFRRIDNTEGFINKYGVLYRKDNHTMKDIKTLKPNKGSYRFKIHGKPYYLNTLLKQLFNTKIEQQDLGLKNLFKEQHKDINRINQEKHDKIFIDGHYKNKQIIKDIPEDIKQIKEYNGRLLKDCYYYSDINYKLYHKIDNTNLYFEIKDIRKDLSEMYKNSRKYYRVKTIDNKTITFVLYRKNN